MNGRSKAIYVFLSLFILISFGCARQPGLPKEIPNDLEIRLETTLVGERYPGPNIPGQSLFRWLNVSGNEISIERVRCEGLVKMTLKDDQIKAIYRSFVENEFDLIENEQSADNTEEAGFREIRLQAGKISKSVKQGKRFPLSEKNRVRFNRIWVGLAELVEESEPCFSKESGRY